MFIENDVRVSGTSYSTNRSCPTRTTFVTTSYNVWPFWEFVRLSLARPQKHLAWQNAILPVPSGFLPALNLNFGQIPPSSLPRSISLSLLSPPPDCSGPIPAEWWPPSLGATHQWRPHKFEILFTLPPCLHLTQIYNVEFKQPALLLGESENIICERGPLSLSGALILHQPERGISLRRRRGRPERAERREKWGMALPPPPLPLIYCKGILLTAFLLQCGPKAFCSDCMVACQISSITGSSAIFGPGGAWILLHSHPFCALAFSLRQSTAWPCCIVQYSR